MKYYVKPVLGTDECCCGAAVTGRAAGTLIELQ